jgi:hypothetical protein
LGASGGWGDSGDGDEEAALGDALGSVAAEAAFEFVGREAAGEGFAEGDGDGGEFIRGFVGEFEAVVGDACGEPGFQMPGGVLGFGSEDGVAAAGVGEDGVGAAVGIAEGDAVLFAGAAAVFVAGSGGEEAAEDAVFGVEDGEVVVGDGFDGSAGEGLGEVLDLEGRGWGRGVRGPNREAGARRGRWRR